MPADITKLLGNIIAQAPLVALIAYLWFRDRKEKLNEIRSGSTQATRTLERGHQRIAQMSSERKHQAIQLQEQIQQLDGEIIALKQEVALRETNIEVDRESYREVEANLTLLQGKIQEQRDGDRFAQQRQKIRHVARHATTVR